LSDKGNLTWRLDGSYKSETYKDPQNEPDILQDDLFLLNARIVFDTQDERWQLALFCTNLTDEKYITRGLHFSDFGFTNHYAGRPQEWGASLRYRF
jgi:iron complex outermembrane receptor protein